MSNHQESGLRLFYEDNQFFVVWSHIPWKRVSVLIRLVMIVSILLTVSCADDASIPADGGLPPDGDVPDSTTDGGGSHDGSMVGQSLFPSMESEIDRVMFYQSHAMLIADGSLTQEQDVPIIAGKAGLFFVYLTSSSSPAADLQAVVRFQTKGDVIEVSSQDLKTEEGKPFFEISIPEGAIDVGTKLQVELVESAGDRMKAERSERARFPRQGGFHTLDVALGPTLEVVVVPIAYNADESGRLPDTSAGVIDKLQAAFLAMYPTAEVKISVFPSVFSYDKKVLRTDADSWANLMKDFRDFRREQSPDTPTSSPFFLGLVAPADDYFEYCEGSCFGGWAPINRDARNDLKLGVATGYDNLVSRNNALHEIGHAFGREHPSKDESYPLADAGLDIDGYNFLEKEELPATEYFDIMANTSPKWISAYTYNAISERFLLDASQRFIEGASSPGQFVLGMSMDEKTGAFGQPFLTHRSPTAAVESFQAYGPAGNLIKTVAAEQVKMGEGGSLYYLPYVDGIEQYRSMDGKLVLELERE